MTALHQMGYDSDNLLAEPEMRAFSGAVLSPVNYTEATMQTRVLPRAGAANLQLTFDPQLYYPKTERGQLRSWGYFPQDLDSGDLASVSWWQGITAKLLTSLESLGVHRACSPVAVPRAFPDAYFEVTIRVASMFCDQLSGTGIVPLQTIVVPLRDLADPERPMAIASIASQTACAGVYLVLVSDTPPQRELADVEELIGALRLIRSISRSGLPLTVAFSSSDMVLYRAAGAAECATGKFFNVRRFSPSRFAEEGSGFGQLEYWFEEGLMAFLRTSDLLRVRNAGLESASSLGNPLRDQVAEAIAEERAWLALGWRQYMAWFADADARISAGQLDVAHLLRAADSAWSEMDKRSILMEARHNDGTWVRAWRRALVEF